MFERHLTRWGKHRGGVRAGVRMVPVPCGPRCFGRVRAPRPAKHLAGCSDPRPPSDSSSMPAPGVRAIAFYLPQFHRVPENDALVGPGFTEWHNVATARPLFRGHYQPHVPPISASTICALPDVRRPQATWPATTASRVLLLALLVPRAPPARAPVRRGAGLRAARLPLLPLLGERELDPAAGTATRPKFWCEQRYSPDDDRAGAPLAGGVFADPRYLRVDGRPLFLVYRTARLPDPCAPPRCGAGGSRRWPWSISPPRARRELSPRSRRPGPIGFDAAVEFAPDWSERWGARDLMRGPLALASESGEHRRALIGAFRRRPAGRGLPTTARWWRRCWPSRRRPYRSAIPASRPRGTTRRGAAPASMIR